MLELNCIGNLGSDSTKVEWMGNKFLSFNIGVTEKRTNDKKEKIETTRWVSCTMAYSEVFEKYLKKGKKVFVRGKLKVKQWEKDGKTGIDVGMRVLDIIFL